MSEYFIGQIMLTGFGFAPKYFALCNGQLLPIAQNQALFSLLGTQFGGNGTTNFALPNMMSRVPVGAGFSSVDPGWQPSQVSMGEVGGVENVTLNQTNLPAHTHQFQGTASAGTSRNPAGKIYGTSTAAIYASPGATVPLDPSTVAPAGGTQPHSNIQPYETINFTIALQGIFPSRN
ncbi:phage tail protein [Lysobacter fragariae]